MVVVVTIEKIVAVVADNAVASKAITTSEVITYIAIKDSSAFDAFKVVFEILSFELQHLGSSFR